MPDPVLQQLEDPTSLDVTVNDCFRPVARFFDRINRPEQLISSLLSAMRVLIGLFLEIEWRRELG